MGARRLRVDWLACKAHGVCAELIPELITTDEWGYPLIAATPVPPELSEHAHRAVSGCPTLALKLVDVDVPEDSGSRRARRQRSGG